MASSSSNSSRVHLLPLWHLPITRVRLMIDQTTSENDVSIYLINECGSAVRVKISQPPDRPNACIEYQTMNTDTSPTCIKYFDVIVKDETNAKFTAYYVHGQIGQLLLDMYTFHPTGKGIQFWIITLITLLESQDLLITYSALEAFGILSKFYLSDGTALDIDVLAGTFDVSAADRLMTELWVLLIEQAEGAREQEPQLETLVGLAGRLTTIHNTARSLWDTRYLRDC